MKMLLTYSKLCGKLIYVKSLHKLQQMMCEGASQLISREEVSDGTS
jgi:hypothetical protein